MYNYGGINESSPSKVMSKWNIMLHLPEITQKKFVYLTAEFLQKVNRYNQKQLKKKQEISYTEQQEADEAMAAAMLDDSPDKKQKVESIMDAVDDIKKGPDHEFICKLITEHFSHKIFDIVCDFNMKKSTEDDIVDLEEEDYESDQEEIDDGMQGRNQYVEQRKRRERERIAKELRRWDFPKTIGSYHKYKSPALEFSKFISTHIFGLDEAFYHEAHQLKMNLLRMIRCKEFSDEVQNGLEPSLILVLPDVICDMC